VVKDVPVRPSGGPVACSANSWWAVDPAAPSVYKASERGWITVKNKAYWKHSLEFEAAKKSGRTLRL
jgi:hypothetical protein